MTTTPSRPPARTADTAATSAGAPAPTRTDDRAAALRLARRPWRLATTHGDLRVSGALLADLAGVARMHGRCSAGTLLQRYLLGGRAPSLSAQHALLAQPLAVVARAATGDVVALGLLTSPAGLPDTPAEPVSTLQLGIVVEDAWQRRGVGRALTAHLAAAARLLGVRELVADVASPTLPLGRVMAAVGETRSTRHALGRRVRTRLDDSALAGLGPLSGVLAG